jgi:hypothetical protein
MPANHSSSLLHYLAGQHPGRLGWLIGPSAVSKTKLRPWMPYALDNDAYSAWFRKREWNADAWRSMLSWAKQSGLRPRWTLVPDVVADKDATIENWHRYAPEAKSWGWPLAFAVQDGMEPTDVPTGADVIFVGGTAEWKWDNLLKWTRNFKRVHVGRVNELQRLWECQAEGVESVDGTGWFRATLNGRQGRDLVTWLTDNKTAETRRKIVEAKNQMNFIFDAKQKTKKPLDPQNKLDKVIEPSNAKH